MTSYLTTHNQYLNQIAYRELGTENAGLPLVMLTHLSATLDEWDPLFIDQLAAKNHLVVIDLPGVGASSGQVPLTIEAMTDQAVKFTELRGFKKINLLGLSMGGMIAQAVAEQAPQLVERLILVGTGPRGGKGIDRVSLVTFTAMLKAFFKRTDPKRYIFYLHDQRGAKEAERVLNRLRQRTPDFADQKITIASFRRQLRAIKKWGTAPADNLSRITMPTLIINGDNDTMVPTSNSYQMHELIKNSELLIFPNAGHGSIFQYAIPAAEMISSFLKG